MSQTRSGHFGEEKNPLSLYRIKPRLLGCKVHSVVTIQAACSYYYYSIEMIGAGVAAGPGNGKELMCLVETGR